MGGYKEKVSEPDKCWYCGGTHGSDDGMMFSIEFDTYVHKECLERHVLDKDDREAQIMGRELLD